MPYDCNASPDETPLDRFRRLNREACREACREADSREADPLLWALFDELNADRHAEALYYATAN